MKAHSGHVGTSGLQAHSLGTVYPFGVVSKGDRLFYSVDYRKPLRVEMEALPHFSYESAFLSSMLRRVAEYCGSDDSSIMFSVSTKRPAGKELELHGRGAAMSWEHVTTLKPLTPNLLGFSLGAHVEEGVIHQLVSIGDGTYALWRELTL